MQEMNAKGKPGSPLLAQSILLKKTREKRNELYNRWGCPRWRTYLPLLQLPVWLTAIEAIREMCGQQSGLLGMAFRTKIDGIAQVLPIQESFATEGMLWFPDLMVSDPQLILPFILSGTIYLNITRGSSRIPKTSLWQKRFDRSLKVVALAIGPLTLQVPSAMLLYWIASSSFAYAQGFIVEKAIPLKSQAAADLSKIALDLEPAWKADSKLRRDTVERK